MKGTGTDATTVRARLAEMEAAYVRGLSDLSLMRTFSARWGLSRRSVRRYIRAMRRDMLLASERAEKPEARLRRRELARRRAEAILEAAFAEGDWKAATGANEQMIRVDQLNERTDAELARQGRQRRPLQDLAPAELRDRARGLRKVGA